MAQPKKRQLKKPVESVREKAAKASVPKKPRKLSKVRNTAAKPFGMAGKALAKVLRPFGFLLTPFKTRPMRFIGNILATVLLLRYFLNSWRELRQVNWPDRKQTAQLTLAVFIFAIFFGLLIAVTDYGLDKVFKKLIIK